MKKRLKKLPKLLMIDSSEADWRYCLGIGCNIKFWSSCKAHRFCPSCEEKKHNDRHGKLYFDAHGAFGDKRRKEMKRDDY